MKTTLHTITRRLLLLALLLATALPAVAYDFMEDGLCYKVNSGKTTVTVTYQKTTTYYGNTYGDGYENLTGDLVIPENVTHLGKTYQVTSIGDRAFINCTGLTSVTIPNTVTTIGGADPIASDGAAFCNCTGLTSIVIPNSVTLIGKNSFNSCTGLTSVTIGESVTWIGERAFEKCTGLTSVTIPNSVTTIDRQAFFYCTGLTSVTYGNSITWINNGAFSNCTSLTSLSLPSSLTYIGDGAFEMCTSLIEVTIPDSVTWIGGYAFRCCSGLTSADLGNSVTEIGYGAFQECTGLTSILIPNSVITVRTNAFFGCTGLKSATIGDNVNYIYDKAFSQCSSLEEIVIGESVLEIEAEVFSGCTSLKTVKWNAKESNNFIFSESPFYCMSNIEHFIFGEEVEVIPYCLCYGLSGLTSITIPNSVKDIGFSAFYGCTGLTSVNIGDSVTAIGQSAFGYCISLPSVILPESVRIIEYEAFRGCSSLSTVAIPNSVTNIGGSAFYDCEGLTSVTISNSVVRVGSSSFYNCSSLNTVTFGKNVRLIGPEAFKGCSSLNKVVALMRQPISISSSVFDGAPTESCNLHVRQGSKTSYENQDVWKDFMITEDAEDYAVVEVGESSIEGDVNGDEAINAADITALYDCMLNGDQTYVATSDVNGDGHINSADVTAIYDILLGNDIHEYVDLALPSGTLWATMNIGASSPEEAGDYFAWGETDPELKRYYEFFTYKWCCGTYNTMTKYCYRQDIGIIDNKNELDPDDDAATVNWGPKWRMPSKGQLKELLDECTWEWTNVNGANGYLVTSKHNGASLFLPVPGFYSWEEHYGYNTGSRYWARSLGSPLPCNGYMLITKNGYPLNMSGAEERCWGRSVRAVRVSNY